MDTIANKLDLSDDIKTMSIIDLINFELKKDQIQKIMKEYNNPTEIEKNVIKIYTDEYIQVKDLLSQNYFNNVLSNEYVNNIHMFFNDRILKTNQTIKHGLNEVKKVYLLKWTDVNKSINMKTPIIVNKKEYFIKDNLNKYLQDNIIIDIINKKI